MPLAFAHEAGGERIKADFHLLRLRSLKGGKAAREHFATEKSVGRAKGIFRFLTLAMRVNAKVLSWHAGLIGANQIPLVVNAGEMIGGDLPELRLARTQRKIVKLDQSVDDDGLGQEFEDFDLTVRNAGGVKRDRLRNSWKERYSSRR